MSYRFKMTKLSIHNLVWFALLIFPVQCSVSMREEECLNNRRHSTKCAKSRVGRSNLDGIGKMEQTSTSLLKLQSAVDSGGVDSVVVDAFQSSFQSSFTPLPFAAFHAPSPVFKSSELKVFNVLEREKTVKYFAKGGIRQKDRELKGTSSLIDSEKVSRSYVKFKERKGGVRNRRRQLRRERIERKRNRRKNKRKNKKTNKRKQPKDRKGKKRKYKRGKLKMLKTGGRRRNRKEQIGINPTSFIEEPNSDQKTGQNNHNVEHNQQQMTPTHIGKFINLNHQTSGNQMDKNQNHHLNSNIANNRNLNVVNNKNQKANHNENENQSHVENENHGVVNLDLDDHGDGEVTFGVIEEDETHGDIDMEYFSKYIDDYQVGPEFFNWKFNSSVDYFKQGQGRNVNPDPWAGSTLWPAVVDPSHVEVRREVVRLHNMLRSRVDPPASDMLALSWHGAAAGAARQWARGCGGDRRRDPPSVRWTPRYGACGQNILVTRRRRRWAQVIRTWWSERRFFSYGEEVSPNTTHRARSYTQMVWYSSHKVGCGYAECTTTSGTTFHRYVCNYCPAGNDPNRLTRPYSRGRPCEMCPRACRSVCKATAPSGGSGSGQCRLCTNVCVFSDLWANCRSLAALWRPWLCGTRTQAGVDRFSNCRATCQCAAAGDKIL